MALVDEGQHNTITMDQSIAQIGQLHVEMEQSVHRTYVRAVQNRAPNTSKSYTAKQDEFKQWCLRKGFPQDTRFTVSGPKLHLFLEEEVIGRRSRKRSRNGRTIGKSTVDSYAAAIVDLHSLQTRLGCNSNPHPRNADVQALLKNTYYEQERVRRANYDDRGVGTALDGYTTADQLGKIANFFWTRCREFGPNLRNWVALALSHYAVLRGESARGMELPDLHSIRLENEGISDCHALVMVMRNGKTNHFGRIEVSTCLRNKRVDICPWGAVGFYLFWRWHVEGEPFPAFVSSRDWYDIKLLKCGSDRTKAMSYTTHLQAFNTAFSFIGLQSRAKTHVGRGSGARMAELAGASEAQIRRLGRWNNQSTENCYLSSLPRQALRTLAGFAPEAGTFYIKRSAICRPQSLARKIFPDVEVWMRRLELEGCEANIAAGGFFQLLLQLRTVILQDSVLLRRQFPSHPIWNHSIFSDEEFSDFAGRLEAVIAQAPDPTERRLELVMPDLTKNRQSPR